MTVRLRTPAFGLDDAHRDARGTRRDDRVPRRGVVDVGEQLDLEFRTLRRVLLYEVGVRDGAPRMSVVSSGDRAMLSARARSKQPCPMPPPHTTAGPPPRSGRVRRRHVEAPDEIVRRPTRTDRAGTDDRSAVDGLVCIHPFPRGYSVLQGGEQSDSSGAGQGKTIRRRGGSPFTTNYPQTVASWSAPARRSRFVTAG